MAGKGDTPRPLSVSSDEFARRWERAFGYVEAARERIEHQSGPRELLRPAQTIELKARHLGQLELGL
jgi:hypothetical protein